jgi:cell fate (sporulation/competence/biofilm development) regulator YlbF (YheA/YmcA/DUF963 family)
MSTVSGDAKSLDVDNILTSLLAAEVKKQGVRSKDALPKESLKKVYKTALEKLDQHIAQLEGLLTTLGQNPIIHEFFHARQKLGELSKKSNKPTAEDVETEIGDLQKHITRLQKDQQVQQFIEKEKTLQKAKKLYDEISTISSL